MLSSTPAEVPEWAQAVASCMKTDLKELVQLAHVDMKEWFRQELQEQLFAAHELRNPSSTAMPTDYIGTLTPASGGQPDEPEPVSDRKQHEKKPAAGEEWHRTRLCRQAAKAFAHDVKTRTRETLAEVDKLDSQATPGETLHPAKTGKQEWQIQLLRILDGYAVRIIFLVVLIINSMVIGLEVKQFSDMAIQEQSNNLTLGTGIILLEILLCCLCTLEFGLRCAAEGINLFSTFDWKWNVFDLVCIILQHVDIIRLWFSGYQLGYFQLSSMRVFRVFRYFMLGKMTRHFRPFQELIRSIVHTFSWFFSACVILAAIVYVAALYLAQMVSYNIVSSNTRNEELVKYFGSLGITMLSLYQSITGGIDWGAPLEPLMSQMNFFIVVPFSLYVAFAVLAVFNVITGVFVESALKSAKKGTEQVLVNNMHQLFQEEDGSYNRTTMSFSIFMQNLETQEMKDYFEAIDVDPSDAAGVFRLIDADGSGAVTAEEFFNGSLALSGLARALDMEILKQDTNQLASCVTRGFQIMTQAIVNIQEMTSSKCTPGHVPKHVPSRKGLRKTMCRTRFKHNTETALPTSKEHRRKTQVRRSEKSRKQELETSRGHVEGTPFKGPIGTGNKVSRFISASNSTYSALNPQWVLQGFMHPSTENGALSNTHEKSHRTETIPLRIRNLTDKE